MKYETENEVYENLVREALQKIDEIEKSVLCISNKVSSLEELFVSIQLNIEEILYTVSEQSPTTNLEHFEDSGEIVEMFSMETSDTKNLN